MKANHFIFIFLFSGCSSMYIPSPKNVPLFEKKGEVQIEAGASTNSIFATGNYAFSEKYAFIANGCLSFDSFLKTPNLPNSEFDILPMPSGGFAHRSVEAGFGRYNLKPSSAWKREVFTGIGYGTADKGENWENRYLLGFIQTNIGRKTKRFELGWSFRLAGSYFDYKYPERDYSTGVGRDVILYKKFGVAHAEHVTFMRFGGEHIKGFVRGGINIAYPLFLSSDEYKSIWISRGGYWNFTMFHLSVGLSYCL